MAVRLDEIAQITIDPSVREEDRGRVGMRLDDLQSTVGVKVHRDDLDLAGLQFSEREVNALKAKGSIGFFEGAKRGLRGENAPVLGLPYAVYEGAAIHGAIKRLQKDEYDDSEQKERDFEVAKDAMRFYGEAQIRGYTRGGAIAEGVMQLPAYMVEFAIASFVGAGPGVAAGRAAAGVAARKVVGRTAQRVIAGGARMAVQAGIGVAAAGKSRVAARTYQNEINLNLIPTERGFKLDTEMQSKPFTSFTKALGDVYIEYWSESAGKFIFGPAFKKMGATPLLKSVGSKMTNMYKRLHPSDKVGKLFTRAGWDGFVSEVGEEVLGDQLRAVFNVEDFGSDGNALDRMIAAIPDGDELMVMMGVLAVPGAANVGAQSGFSALNNYINVKREAGIKSKARTLARKILAEEFDVVEKGVEEALKPLPQVELSKTEIEEISVKRREGGVKFEESKPIPDRQIVDTITSSKEYKEADIDRQMEMLIRGRTAELDKQRTAIEKELRRLEKIKNRDKKTEKQLATLSKQLLSIHAQISDVVDSSAEELMTEKVLLPGASLESLRKKARDVGAGIAKRQVEEVFRNKKAQAEERRTALVKYLQARFPGPQNRGIRDRFMLRAAKDMTEAKLQKFFAEIEALREAVRAKQLKERAESILNKMRPVIKKGVKKGVFANANVQELANEVIRVSELSAEEAQKELEDVHSQILKMIANGDGESEAAEELKFKAGLLSTISGLEKRNVDGLEQALQTLSRLLAGFRMDRDTVKALRSAQNKAEELDAVNNILKSEWKPKQFHTKVMKVLGEFPRKLYEFSSFNLEMFWRELGLDKMIGEPLSKISESKAALQKHMDKPVRQAIEDIYGIPKESSRKYMAFLTDRMSIEESKDPNTKPYIKKVKLNTGEEVELRMSRWDVMYYYAVAYQNEMDVDPIAYEALTGEKELQAIREKAEVDKNIDIEEEAAGIKGNAIRAEVLEDMFSELTEQDIQFALKMKQIFTEFWPLINPVYARATGVNLTQLESYIPWIRKTASVKSVEDMFNQYALIEAHVTPFPGSLKERMSTSTAPFAQMGLMDVYMGFRDSMSHWVATHDITARMQKYLKNRNIREAINKVTGGKYDVKTGRWHDSSTLKLIEFHLKGIASRGQTDQSIRVPFMDLMRRNLSRYYLFKLKQFPLQVTSAFTAMLNPDVGFVGLVKGIGSFWRDPAGATKLMNQALSMHNRYKNVMLEMKEVQDLIRFQKDRPIDKLNFLDKFAFMFVRAGNKGGVMIGGWAVFKAAYDKTGSVEEAFKAFDAFVLNTQQSALREQQSASLVGAQRYFFQFTSAVSQYGRIYYKSWNDVIKKPTSKNMTQWARTMVVFHGFIPAARWAIAQIGLPDPEGDEEEEEKRKNRLIAYMVSGPFSGLWFLNDIATFAAYLITKERGFDSGPAVISQMNKVRGNLQSAIKKVAEDEEDPDVILDSILKAEKEAAGLFMGIPGTPTDLSRALFRNAATGEGIDDIPGITFGQTIDMIDYSRGE